jgi:hypothetical protein
MDDAPQWLVRLTAAQWLAAARAELVQGRARLDERRSAVTHARRAAGMALNAVLAGTPGDASRWGRSYVDHLRAVASATDGPSPLPATTPALAAALLSIPLAPALVGLGAARDAEAARALDVAETLLDHAEAPLAACSPRQP